MSETRPSMLFVVAEPGSRWPIWLTHYQHVVPNVVVVAGDVESTPAELTLRAVHRLQTIVSSGQQVHMAVVLVGTEGGVDEVFGARCQLARVLLEHMSRFNRGKLVFATNDSLSSDARHELMGLVDTLTNQLIGTQLGISVRFEPSRTLHPLPIATGFGEVA